MKSFSLRAGQANSGPAGLAATAERITRLLALGLSFVVLYTLANQLTSLRSDVGHGVFEWERAVPFIPWTIVPYLSIVSFFVASFFVGRDRAELDRHVLRLALALAISVLCYALFPLRFAFERPQTEGVPGTLFRLLTALDLPYNRAPSLHISVLLILWVRFAGLPSFSSGLARCALGGWFGLIGLSVFTTYQHHLIDVLAGVAVGQLCVLAFRPRPAPEIPVPAGVQMKAGEFAMPRADSGATAVAVALHATTGQSDAARRVGDGCCGLTDLRRREHA